MVAGAMRGGGHRPRGPRVRQCASGRGGGRLMRPTLHDGCPGMWGLSQPSRQHARNACAHALSDGKEALHDACKPPLRGAPAQAAPPGTFSRCSWLRGLPGRLGRPSGTRPPPAGRGWIQAAGRIQIKQAQVCKVRGERTRRDEGVQHFGNCTWLAVRVHGRQVGLQQ